MVTDQRKFMLDSNSGLYVDHNNVLTYASHGGTRIKSILPRMLQYAYGCRGTDVNIHTGYGIDLLGNVLSISLNTYDGSYTKQTLATNGESLAAARLGDNSSAVFYKKKGDSTKLYALFPDTRDYEFGWDTSRSSNFDVTLDDDVSNIAIAYSKQASPDQVYIDYYTFSNEQPVFVRTVNTITLFNFSLGLRRKLGDSF